MVRRDRLSKGKRTTSVTRVTRKYRKADTVPQEPSSEILDIVKSPGKSKAKKVSGLSLSMKFTIVISFVSGTLCFISGLFVYFNVKTSMIEEIDNKGIAILKSLSNISREYYSQCDRIQTDFKSAKDPEQKNELIGQKERLRRTFESYLENMTSSGGESSGHILSLLIDSNNKQTIPSVSSGDTQGLSGSESFSQEKMGSDIVNIRIIEGNLTTQEGSFGVRAYTFTFKVGVATEMTPYVMLSERDIERTTDAISLAILLTTIIAVLIGTGSSFLLARHVTDPVRKLMKDIEIVAGGKLNHKTTVNSKDEIGVLAHTFNVMTQSLLVAHQNELEHKATEHELEIATDIQANLLPKQIPNLAGLEIAAFYNASKEVGGDYYDFIEIDEDHLGIVVADVSGKGIPGSMVMTMARSLIRMEAVRNLSPSKTLCGVNRIISEDIRRGMFVTAMYCILKKSTREISITSAGHNPAIVYRAQTKKCELINTKGIALGFDRGPLFEKTTEEKKTRLLPGDQIVLYTDGVPEAMSPKDEEFGDDRFYRLIGKNAHRKPGQVVDTILEELGKWRGNGPQSDDITIVALKAT